MDVEHSSKLGYLKSEEWRVEKSISVREPICSYKCLPNSRGEVVLKVLLCVIVELYWSTFVMNILLLCDCRVVLECIYDEHISKEQILMIMVKSICEKNLLMPNTAQVLSVSSQALSLYSWEEDRYVDKLKFLWHNGHTALFSDQ